MRNRGTLSCHHKTATKTTPAPSTANSGLNRCTKKSEVASPIAVERSFNTQKTPSIVDGTLLDRNLRRRRRGMRRRALGLGHQVLKELGRIHRDEECAGFGHVDVVRANAGFDEEFAVSVTREP